MSAELDIQRSFRARMYYACPEAMCVAIPNAARRTQWEARKAKQEGLSAGFPDMMVIGPAGLIAFIEFKSPKGRVSEHQHEWIARLSHYGFPVALCRSADAAMVFLRQAGFAVRERAA